MIKNIVFDLGNVLLSFQPMEYLIHKLSDRSKAEKIHDIIFKSDEWIDLDRGTINEDQALQSLCKKSPEEETHIRNCMNGWHDMLTPILESVDELKRIKSKGYKTYILSNFHENAFKTVTTKNDFFEFFDGGVISFREKLVKPQSEIYMKLVQNYDLKPEETLFIDDMEANVNAARELGFHVIQYKNHQQLLDRLKEYSI